MTIETVLLDLIASVPIVGLLAYVASQLKTELKEHMQKCHDDNEKLVLTIIEILQSKD